MTKVKIKQFKNKAKEPIAGLTPEHAIYDKNGVRLDAKLGNVNLQEFRNLQDEGLKALKEQAKESLEILKEYDHETIINNGTINNAADEEDITVRDNVLSFKDRTYTEGVNEMGYIILRKNKSFAEQVIKENTIYEIRYGFDLKNEEITIPKNCILKFEGGKLYNGTIVGNNTIIKSLGYCIFDKNITFSGTWNGTFNIEWLGLIKDDATFDNAPLIQKALRSFIYTYIPQGIYYCKTSIEATSHTGGVHYIPMYFNCEGSLYYAQQNTSETFIHIGSSGGNISINKIRGFIEYPYNNIDKSTGLCLHDCNQCNINIGQVSGFYKNIEILGDSLGFAYNNIKINALGNAIIGIHLNCINDGWVNSNKFQIFRVYAFGGQLKMTTAILAKSDNSQNASYNDTFIERLSIENLKNSGTGAPIKLYNCSDFRIENFRNENNNTPFIETHDTCKNIQIVPNYYAHNARNSFSVASIDGWLSYTEPLKHTLTFKPFNNGYIKDNSYYSKNGYTIDLSNVISSAVPSYYPIMALFLKKSVVNNPIIIHKTFIGNVYVAYYTKDKQLFNIDDYMDYKPIANCDIKKGTSDSRGFMLDTSSMWNTINIPTLPDEIYYVAIGTTISNNYSTNIDSSLQFNFYSNIILNNITLELESISNYKDYKTISGNTSNRPTGFIGQQYFDTTLNKPIYWTGSTWVDATGTEV